MARLGHIPQDQAFAVGRQLGWPDEVTEQLLFWHGERAHIREQFEDLDLDLIEWSREHLAAGDLEASSHHPQKTRVETVAEDPHFFIDEYRDKGVDIWNDSWNHAPIFVVGHLVDPPGAELHLVEGHTRLGVLRGLLALEELDPESLHECWVARPKRSVQETEALASAHGDPPQPEEPEATHGNPSVAPNPD